MDIKKKLQDEITVLEHELHVELPKEILKAILLQPLPSNQRPWRYRKSPAHARTKSSKPAPTAI